MLLKAITTGLITFGVSFAVLMAAESWIHRLTRDPFKVYRWGVLVFSLLVGAWTFITNLGR